MFFFGVTTGASAIRRIFPRWCALAGVGDAELVGVDLPVGAPAAAYREAVRRVREDAGSCGALVTTHKVAVVEHAGDLIDELDDDARLLGEVSTLVWRQGRLAGLALDVDCSVWALERVVPAAEMGQRSLLILGAGGAGTALATGVARMFPGCAIVATDVNRARLEQVGRLSGARTVAVAGAEETDALVAAQRDGVIVVNATGMGKDIPGAPVTAGVKFPKDAVAWELNYRGDLKFAEYARAAGARTVDGWDYFVFGWSSVMASVLGFELTDGLLGAFRDIAAAERSK